MLELLGTGGIGRVFKGWDPRLRRMVAIKLLHSEDRDSVNRLLREARSQAQLVHPNVCQVYESGMAGDHPYIAMQLIRGDRLDVASGRMTLRERVSVTRDIAAALAAAHRMNLIHRDIKPSNIMVERSDDGTWHPYLLDFGLSRNRVVGDECPASRPEPMKSATDATLPLDLTGVGQVVGTPAYMAPEQAQGDRRAVGERTDVFSLGATLYTILAGEPPFDGDTPADVLEQVVEHDPPPLSDLNTDIPTDLAAIVRRCLAKDPSDRYASAAALEADLRAFLDDEPVIAVRPTVSYVAGKLVKRHPAATVTLAVVAVAVLALGGLWLHERWSATRKALVAATMGHRVSEVDSLLWRARTAPKHDITPHLAEVRERMQRMRDEMAQAGRSARGVGHLALGKAHLALQELPRAEAHLRAAWEEGYRTPEGAFAMAQCTAGLYRRDLAALNHIRDQKVRAARRREIEARYGQELAKWRRRAPNRATMPSKLLDAVLAYHHGRIDEGLRLCDEVLETAPWTYQADLLAGDLHLLQAAEHRSLTNSWFAAIDRARSSFAAAVELAPSDPVCYVAAARADLFVYERCRSPGKEARKLEFIEEGLESASSALECDPNWTPAWRIQSRLLQGKAGQSDIVGHPWRETIGAAVDAAERAVALAPEDPDNHQCLGDALVMGARLGSLHGDDVELDLQKAITSLRRVVELRGSFTANLALGIAERRLAAYRMGRGLDGAEDALESAARSFEEALKYRPGDRSTWHNLGRMHHTRGRLAARSGADPTTHYQRSESAFERAIEGNPESGVPLNSLGNLRTDMAEWLARSGEPPWDELRAAVSAFEEAMSVAPHYAFAANNLAAVLVLRAKLRIDRGLDPTEDLDRADRLLDLALEWRVGYGTPLFNRGTVHRARAEHLWRDGSAKAESELRAAVVAFTEGLERRKDVAEAEAKLGETYLAWAEHRLEQERPVGDRLEQGSGWVSRALEHDPTLSEGWRCRLYGAILRGERALGDGQAVEKFLVSADRALAEARRIDPSHPDLLRLTARLQLLRAKTVAPGREGREGYVREGLHVLDPLLTVSEPSTRILILAARLHLIQGGTDARVAAERLLRRAVSVDPRLGSAARRLLEQGSSSPH